MPRRELMDGARRARVLPPRRDELAGERFCERPPPFLVWGWGKRDVGEFGDLVRGRGSA